MNIDDQIFHLAITILVVICSLISFVVSILALIQIYIKKISVTFARILMIYLTVSEIINSFSKLPLIYKFFTPFSEYSLNKGICNAQVILALFSDYLTLINSTILAVQVYSNFNDKEQWFKQSINKIKIQVLIFVIPSLMTIIFGILHFIESDNKSKPNWNDKSFIWCWVNPRDSMIIYGSYIFMLAIIVIYSKKTMNGLKQQKANLEELINQEQDDYYYVSDAEKNIHKVHYSLTKISYYPRISFCIWFFLFVHRITEFILSCIQKDFALLNKILVTFHGIICSGRGIVYGAVYLGYGLLFCKSFNEMQKENKNENTEVTMGK